MVIKPSEQLKFTVSNPVDPESILQNFAMQTQHDVFVLLWLITLGAIGFLIVYRICETIERIWGKKNGSK